MTNESRMFNPWDCRLYVGAWGGVGSSYLGQELPAEMEQAGLSVVIDTPQLVGVADAHIE